MALDSSDLKNLSMREKLIIAFTFVFAVTYSYYEFEYTVQKNKLKKLKTDLVQVQSSLGAFQQLMKNPAKVKKNPEKNRKN
ncbi:MAG: hypothetical protein VW455_00930 [Nitrospinota bacterium]